MVRLFNNILEAIVAVFIIVVMHIAAFISIVRLIIEKVFEYVFKFILLIVFILLLVLCAFKPDVYRSWNEIKLTWNDFVNFICGLDYEDLLVWYKNVFTKEDKRKAKIEL